MQTILVTGERAVGKSTLLQRLVQTRFSHYNMTKIPDFYGVVTRTTRTPAEKERTIYAQLLPDREEVILASTCAQTSFLLSGPRLGPFQFSQSACDKANHRLVNGSGDIAVIDEIGPLELVHQAGFWPGLSATLITRNTLVAVVRPDLVSQLSVLLERHRPAGGLSIYRLESTETAESVLPRIVDQIAVVQGSRAREK